MTENFFQQLHTGPIGYWNAISISETASFDNPQTPFIHSFFIIIPFHFDLRGIDLSNPLSFYRWSKWEREELLSRICFCEYNGNYGRICEEREENVRLTHGTDPLPNDGFFPDSIPRVVLLPLLLCSNWLRRCFCDSRKRGLSWRKRKFWCSNRFWERFGFFIYVKDLLFSQTFLATETLNLIKYICIPINVIELKETLIHFRQENRHKRKFISTKRR